MSNSPSRKFDMIGGAPTHAIVFWTFFVLVMLSGGASRSDTLALVILRPLSVLALFYGLWVQQSQNGLRLPIPFLLLLALVTLIALQLVPLPPSMWMALPGRDVVTELTEAAEIAPSWRPLSLAPAMTWNSLFSLTVPLAAMALYSIQSTETKKRILPAFVVAGAISIGLGILQLADGADSVLYHYRIHTEGNAVGLFANRNHQAMFISMTLLATVAAWIQIDRRRSGFVLISTLFAGYALITVPFVLILGSRAGLGLTVLAFVIGAIAVLKAGSGKAVSQPGKVGPFQKFINSRAALTVVSLGVFFGIGVLAVLASRGEAFLRLSDSGRSGPMNRAEILPHLVQMAQDQLPLGSGFGSFSQLFKQYETTEMLSTFYLNQAHNDWLQVVIEGGIPAAIILLAFLGWLAKQLVATLRTTDAKALASKLCLLGMFLFMAFGSAVDYPVRVPIVMMVLSFASLMILEPNNFFSRRTNS